MRNAVKCLFFLPFAKYARQLVASSMSTSTLKWRTLVARYARDNCVLTLMITRNYVCAALYVHWAHLRLTTTLYIAKC